MKRNARIGIAFASVFMCCTLWATAQEQQQKQPDASGESSAFQAAHNEADPQAKINLLDDFAAKYPDSVLLPLVYVDSYLTYFAMGNYPQAVDYADKVAAFGDKLAIDSRILALLSREVAYSAGCSAAGLRTPEALAKARDAGRQGLQLIGQWQKADSVSEEQFDANKKSFAIIFHGVTEMAESGLAGQQVDCSVPRRVQAKGTVGTPDNHLYFEQMINEIKEQERQSPRVR